MLHYIYTDEVEISEDDAVELLTLANQYALDKLKALCEDFIEKGIDVENVAWLLGLAFSSSSLNSQKLLSVIMPLS